MLILNPVDQVDATTTRFQVLNTETSGYGAAKLVITGNVDVFNQSAGTIEQWLATLDIGSGNLDLEAPTTPGEGDLMVLQPWQVNLRGQNGEWIAPVMWVLEAP